MKQRVILGEDVYKEVKQQGVLVLVGRGCGNTPFGRKVSLRSEVNN